MDSDQFIKACTDMMHYIVNYLETIRERRVMADVEPGFLHKILPAEAPQKAEAWEDILSDVETKIMPGITHWQHPRFFAYFPNGNSYPNVLADMLVDALAVQGFSWVTSPSVTELETIMLDWVGKMIGLPNQFLFNGKDSKGGGVLHTSASECIFTSCLAARNQAMKRLIIQYPGEDQAILRGKLVAYCSRSAHSSAEKAAFMSFVKIKLLNVDDEQRILCDEFRKVIEQDIADGLIPFWIEATIGSTSTCAFDNLLEMGPICEDYNIWLHVDASYAGAAFICPELREPLRGIEYVHSLNFNPYKWMLISSDGACLWVTDRYKFTEEFGINAVYLQHTFSAAVDYRHWGIALSRKFRSLKFWFVIRTYGVEGLQKHIREHCRLAKVFEMNVRGDKRFEIPTPPALGVVCFRLIGTNDENRDLIMNINANGLIHLTPSEIIIQGKSMYILRFVICSQYTTEEDISFTWNVISYFATKIKLNEQASQQMNLKSMKETDCDSISSRTKIKNSKKLKQSFFINSTSDSENIDHKHGKPPTKNITEECVIDSKNEVIFNPRTNIETLRDCLLNEEMKKGDVATLSVKYKSKKGEIFYSYKKRESE